MSVDTLGFQKLEALLLLLLIIGKILPEGFSDFVQREKAHEIRAPKRISGEFPLFLQFSRSAVSDSLLSHGLQHASLPCPASLHQLPELTQTHVH